MLIIWKVLRGHFLHVQRIRKWVIRGAWCCSTRDMHRRPAAARLCCNARRFKKECCVSLSKTELMLWPLNRPCSSLESSVTTTRRAGCSQNKQQPSALVFAAYCFFQKGVDASRDEPHPPHHRHISGLCESEAVLLMFCFTSWIPESHSWAGDSSVGEGASVPGLAAGQQSVQLHDTRHQVSTAAHLP